MSTHPQKHPLTQGRQAGARYALTLPRHAPMGSVGSQLGNAAGSSLEFRDHREYQPGDDLRRIDWAAFGRSDRLHVKIHREEVNPHLDLLIDGSRSMDLPDSQKAPATLALAAALTTAARNSRYTHTAYLARDGCHPIPRSSDDPAAWPDIAFDHAGPLPESFHRLPPRWRPRSIRILLSDLLWLGDPAEVLQPLAHNAAAVVVIQLLAEADAHPPRHGNLRLIDSETGRLHEIYLDTPARNRYRQSLARHQENWHRAAQQLGATFTTLLAEPTLSTWDLTPLVRHQILKPA